MKNKFMNISMEETATGKTVVENEKVFYGEIIAPTFLLSAESVEEQEQHQITIEKSDTNLGGRIRVRATRVLNSSKIEYVQTVKVKMQDGSLNETSIPVSEDIFKQFSLLSNNGMKKTRYIIPIKDRLEKWEIDIFNLPDGSKANWCKIDLEFVSDNTTIPDFPLGFREIIDGDTTDEDDKQFIRKLYTELFFIKK